MLIFAPHKLPIVNKFQIFHLLDFFPLPANEKKTLKEYMQGRKRSDNELSHLRVRTGDSKKSKNDDNMMK